MRKDILAEKLTPEEMERLEEIERRLDELDKRIQRALDERKPEKDRA